MKSDLFYKVRFFCFSKEVKIKVLLKNERIIFMVSNNEAANFCHLLRYASFLLTSMFLVILTLESKKMFIIMGQEQVHHFDFWWNEFFACVNTKNCTQVSEWKLKVSERVEVVERNQDCLLFSPVVLTITGAREKKHDR